ncbi:MAG TPA: hypothetical protein VE757_05760 [Gaiellaceae bacterium]|jgi:hypothetical protein|nr:hypothetical protein [Gaiellaceae bacterium]
MPTRKQRRRRKKELRHEYEYVYVDPEGNEVEVDAAEREPKDSRRNGARDSKVAASRNGKSSRPVKEVQPPSWSRVTRRALIFGPLIFIAFSLINTSQPLLNRLAIAAVYTAFFIPFMYLLDRTLYKSYQRRTGQRPSGPAGRKR